MTMIEESGPFVSAGVGGLRVQATAGGSTVA